MKAIMNLATEFNRAHQEVPFAMASQITAIVIKEI
jgi:hypothetical protein